MKTIANENTKRILVRTIGKSDEREKMLKM